MKKVLAFILCAAMLLALAVPALAATPLHDLDGDDLRICGLPKEDVTVTVNGHATKDFRYTTLQAENAPILYYCIVDPSSSFANVQRQQQQQVLTALNQNLRDCDRMVLAKMGTEVLDIGPILETQEERQAAIDATWTRSWRTRLYEDIITGMSDVSNNSAYAGFVPCVVLITDGINEGSKLQDLAQDAILRSGIRFHSVAVLCTVPTPYAINNGNRALELATQGAVAKMPLVDNSDPADVGQQIAKNMLESTAIRLNTAGLDRSAAKQTIEITAAMEQKPWKATVEIPTAQLPALPVPETVPETIPETVPETVPETTVSETTAVETEPPAKISHNTGKGGIPIGLFIGSFVVLLLIVLAVVFLLWRRQQDDEDIPEPKPQPPVPEEAPAPEEPEELDLAAWAAALGVEPDELDSLSAQADEIMNLPGLTLDRKPAAVQEPPILVERQPEATPEPAIPMPEPTPAEPEADPLDFPIPDIPDAPAAAPAGNPIPVPGCRLKLVATVDRDWSSEYFLPVNEEKSFGRGQDADFLLNETDYGLSSIHFEMLWDGRALFIRDKNSTNGTALNNVPLVPEKWVRLKKNPVILAGAYAYKVSFTK